ncbi:MAG TPA: sensor domain-containing protein [Actinocrinis sp.]|nr:sensor domain-containing protein [Actinocrinis sp.]
MSSIASGPPVRPLPFWRAPFARRTWSELLYCLVGLPLGVAGFAWTVAWFSAGVGVAVTVIGLWVLIFAVLSARWLGALDRGLLNSLLGERIEVPRPVARRHGRFGLVFTYLLDPVGWRAMAYQVIRFPLALASFIVAVTFWVWPLGAFTYPFWRRFLPAQVGSDGQLHRGNSFPYLHGKTYFIDTWPRMLVQIGIGVVFLWLTPWIVHGFTSLPRLLGRALLGPTATMRRVQDLELTRSQAVTSSNEQLRRIERDLHDGTQARLVALAMHLGQAKEDLESTDPEAAARARLLIAGAHQQTKETLTELRDLARGIHPAILDDGLESALTSLGARSPVHVTLSIDLPERPSPTSETIAYFAIAELLTNAVKHSRAADISVLLLQVGAELSFVVGDDGRGGALPGAGTGIAGVAARLAAVDGQLTVDSPVGGPTRIIGTLPLRA